MGSTAAPSDGSMTGGQARPAVTRITRRRTTLAVVGASLLLAACAGSPPSNSPATTSGLPSGAPSAPTTTPPAMTPTAGATATADPIVAAFIALTQAPDRSMRIATSGTVRFMGQEVRLTSEYDLRGDDYRGSTTMEAEAYGAMTVEVASIGGRAYANNGHGWTGATSATPAQDPFRGIVAADVAVAGPVDIGGSPGHLLRLRDPAAAFGRAMGVTNPDLMSSLSVRDATFEVRVDGAGRPVSASVSIRGTASTVGEVEAALEYVVTDWGAVAEIRPPVELPPTPAPGDVLTAYNRTTSDILLRDGNGVELAVPACGSASATTFDVTRFDVRRASDGSRIAAEYPREDSFVTRVVVVGADFLQTSPNALLEPLPACRDLVAR